MSDRDRITFWLGCNVLRHGDIIHACVDILKAIDVDAKVVGGPDYCCGTTKDSNVAAAAGMAKRTAANLRATERSTVVAWCPSCHVHMSDVISRAEDTGFSLGHFIELLHGYRERLAPLLTRAVPMRVLVHEHHGFDRALPVHDMARELLALIPGVTVVRGGYRAPATICSSLGGLPHVMQDLCEKTLAEARAGGAEALITIFHQCYRELLGLQADGHIAVYNTVHLLARSMGIAYEDEYKAWKAAGGDAKSAIGSARVAAMGEALVDRAIVPELQRRPYRPS